MNRYCLFLIPALLLAGCAGVVPQPPVTPAAPEVVTLPSGESVVVESETRPLMSGNQAVIALLDRARMDSAGGKREAAGASLERALRIEPRNAWLWHELAQLRLAQGQYAQSIALAQKSISFSGNERRLQALNWRVVGNARVAQGDPSGAEQAFKLATELEQK